MPQKRVIFPNFKLLYKSVCWIPTVENLYLGTLLSSHLPPNLSAVSTKSFSELQYYLEEVIAVHSKNCQAIVLTPEGLLNSITRANLNPT